MKEYLSFITRFAALKPDDSNRFFLWALPSDSPVWLGQSLTGMIWQECMEGLNQWVGTQNFKLRHLSWAAGGMTPNQPNARLKPLPFWSFWVDDPLTWIHRRCPAQTGQWKCHPSPEKTFWDSTPTSPIPETLLMLWTSQAAGMLGIFWPFLRMPRFQRKRNSLIAFLGWLTKASPGKKDKKTRTQDLTQVNAGSTSRIGTSILGANLLEAQHCQPQANLNYSMHIEKTHDSSATLPHPPLASVPGQTRSASEKVVVASLHWFVFGNNASACARVLQRRVNG